MDTVKVLEWVKARRGTLWHLRYQGRAEALCGALPVRWLRKLPVSAGLSGPTCERCHKHAQTHKVLA